jgi:nucleoside-diphosphate-sugar epimerase
MKILLTGANGFVGSHILEELTANNHNVSAVVRKTSNLKWINKNKVSLKYGSLEDENFLKEVVSDVDIVVHCAGIVRALNWDDYNNINVLGTKKLVQSVLKNNPDLKKFIFISSQAAMGPSLSENPKLLSEKKILYQITAKANYWLSRKLSYCLVKFLIQY